MKMEQAIRGFAEQFTFEPRIQNADKLKKFSKFMVVGMGGSHLSADLLKAAKPELDLVIHSDYGLPALSPADLRTRLIILNSYSGNTEEVLDAFEAARKQKLHMFAISIGGKLLHLAQEHNLPFIQMPDTGLQPRSAIGFNAKALLKAMGEDEALKDISKLAGMLKPDAIEAAGKALAAQLQDKVPVVYADQRHAGIAYNWKAKLNETGKTPAFYNVWPELNHNEMTGFSAGGGPASGGDVHSAIRQLADKFHFIFLRDADSSSLILKRLEITKKIYEDRKLPVAVINLEGKNIWEKIFHSMVLADWTAYHLGTAYGAETTEVPLVEEFKKLMA